MRDIKKNVTLSLYAKLWGKFQKLCDGKNIHPSNEINDYMKKMLRRGKK